VPEHGDTMADPPKDMGGIGNRLVESWDGRDYERHSSALRAPNMAARHPDINFRRMLKNPFSPRVLKKVQMQGEARCEVRGVLSPYVAAPRERGGTHRRWVSADGPFSAAC